MPRLHPAGMFLLIAFLTASWLFRKSFCGWLCPVGTISEYLWRLGRQTFGRNYRLPRKLDIALRSLKYLLLALFVFAVGSMTVPAILAFLEGPYGIVDDVKMLNFFRFMGLTGGIVVAGLVLASVFVQNFWCRYLCPYGALMGLASLASPLRIRREAALCIDCGKCAKACPSALPVDKLITIRFRGVHRVPGVRRQLSGGGRVDDVGAAQTPRPRVGHRRRNRGPVLRHLRVCAVARLLAHRPGQPGLFRADSARQRVHPPALIALLNFVGAVGPAVQHLADFARQLVRNERLLQERRAGFRDAVVHHGLVGVARDVEDANVRSRTAGSGGSVRVRSFPA